MANTFIKYFEERHGKPFLLQLSIVNEHGWNVSYVTTHTSYMTGIRRSSTVSFAHSSGGNTTYAWFNKDSLYRKTSDLNIVMTIFVAFMLVAGSVVVNNDIQILILTPIEQMMNMVALKQSNKRVVAEDLCIYSICR